MPKSHNRTDPTAIALILLMLMSLILALLVLDGWLKLRGASADPIAPIRAEPAELFLKPYERFPVVRTI